MSDHRSAAPSPSRREPRLSVIIATYNRGPALRETLDSVVRQDLPVEEIVVVDDGSTDDTADIARRFHPSVRVVVKPNGGTSSARNAGAYLAKGERLLFLDHDDLLLPAAARTLDTLLDRFPEASAAYADHQILDVGSGRVTPDHHRSLPEFGRLARIPVIRSEPRARLYGKALHHALLHGNLLQQPWVVRRDAFLDLGGFRTCIRYCEDWDLYLRLTFRHEVVLTDEVISIHRIEGTNLHLTAWQRQFEMYERTLSHEYDYRAALPLAQRVLIRRRIANFRKTLGDDAMNLGRHGEALMQYRTSARWWPLDPVVIARAIAWSFTTRSMNPEDAN